VAGYYVGIPAGFMIGSMLLVILAKLLSARIGKAHPIFGEAGGILLGTFAGALFNRETLGYLGAFLIPAVVVIVCLIVLGLLVGWLLARLGKLDLLTCLFGITPGGIAEMVAVSRETGADHGMVVALQLLRFYAVLAAALLFLRWLAL